MTVIVETGLGNKIGGKEFSETLEAKFAVSTRFSSSWRAPRFGWAKYFQGEFDFKQLKAFIEDSAGYYTSYVQTTKRRGHRVYTFVKHATCDTRYLHIKVEPELVRPLSFGETMIGSEAAA